MYSSVALLLLAAVAGYWVLDRASHQKGQLKQVGQIIGTVVIVVSLLGTGCKAWHLVSGKGYDHHWKKSSKCSYCPYSKQGKQTQSSTRGSK